MNTSINLYKSFEIWSNREVVFTCFVFFNLISRVYNFQKWPNYRHSRKGHVRERKSWRPCNVQRKRKRTNLAAILCRLYTASCASQRLGIMKLRLVYEGTEWQNKRKCVDEASLASPIQTIVTAWLEGRQKKLVYLLAKQSGNGVA